MGPTKSGPNLLKMEGKITFQESRTGLSLLYTVSKATSFRKCLSDQMDRAVAYSLFERNK